MKVLGFPAVFSFGRRVTGSSADRRDAGPPSGGNSPIPPEIAAAISDFGEVTARKLRRIGRDEDCVPQPEEQLREPMAALLTRAGRRLGQDVLLYGEVSLRSLKARPDFGVDVGGRLDRKSTRLNSSHRCI